MSEVGMRSDVQGVLAQMKMMRAQAEAGLEATPAQDTGKPGAPNESFATTLKTATDTVNQLQEQSGALSAQFVRGETNDLVGVMVASQKANVAFQGLVHTRNHLVKAYQEIMNMTI